MPSSYADVSETTLLASFSMCKMVNILKYTKLKLHICYQFSWRHAPKPSRRLMLHISECTLKNSTQQDLCTLPTTPSGEVKC